MFALYEAVLKPIRFYPPSRTHTLRIKKRENISIARTVTISIFDP
jgi:hypothetical protein